MFDPIKINKLNGGLGRTNPPLDNVFGIVMGGVAVVSKAQLNTVYRLLSPEDAEDLGLNAAYDANNKVLVYTHIAEYFRLDPNGELFIMLVAQDTTQAAMWDKTAGPVRTMVLSVLAARKIKYVATVLNPETGYAPTITTNIDADVLAAIPKAQETIDDLAGEQIFIDGGMIEGRNFGSSISTAADLRALNKGNVSVCIGADAGVHLLDADFVGTAAVGSALGMLSVRQINENLGSVDIKNKPAVKKGEQSYPLSDGIVWLSAKLSGGTVVSTLTKAKQKDLTTKGYIYVGSYEGFAGCFFNDSPTSTALSSDYNRIENNRVWNAAARIVREVLIPKIKTTLKVDSATGFIKASTASGLAAVVNNALKVRMIDADKCSDARCTIDPAQILSDDAPLNIRVKVVKDNILHEMSIDLGLSQTV